MSILHPARLAIAFLVVLISVTQTWAAGKGFMLCTHGKTPAEVQRDAADLRDYGATMVRCPLYFTANPSLDHWLAVTDAVMAVTEPARMTLVIVFLWPSVDIQGSTITDTRDFVARWSAIAQHYRLRGSRNRIWYDLCNEPNHPRWRAVALSAARAIRRHDMTHPIVMSARGTHVANVEPLPGISRQVLQVHFYDWWDDLQRYYPPHSAYPNSTRGYTKERLRRKLEFVKNLRERHDVQVYIGEVAIAADHPNADRFLRDFTSLCDEMGIHLTIHAFREAENWDYEQNRLHNPQWNPRVWPVLTAWLARR